MSNIYRQRQEIPWQITLMNSFVYILCLPKRKAQKGLKSLKCVVYTYGFQLLCTSTSGGQ